MTTETIKHIVRLGFEKTGRAKYISHLDLMTVFRRSFARAGVSLWHSEGFNPHPYISVLLPLPVGAEGRHELMDIRLVRPEDGESLCERVNPFLPEGLRLLEAYNNGRPVRELVRAAYTVLLELSCAHDNHARAVKAMFDRDTVIVPRRTKKGERDTDIRPMILSLGAGDIDRNHSELTAVLSAGSAENLNPEVLISAMNIFLPEHQVYDASVSRTALLDEEGQEFR